MDDGDREKLNSQACSNPGGTDRPVQTPVEQTGLFKPWWNRPGQADMALSDLEGQSLLRIASWFEGVGIQSIVALTGGETEQIPFHLTQKHVYLFTRVSTCVSHSRCSSKDLLLYPDKGMYGYRIIIYYTLQWICWSDPHTFLIHKDQQLYIFLF